VAAVGRSDAEEFLARPLTAHLATHGPHVRPVWFLWEDDAFWILTGSWSRVQRDVNRDPRVALAVDTTNLATGDTRQVLVTGRAEILPWDGDRGERMLRKYLGDDTGAWDHRFQRYLEGESGSVWLRVTTAQPKLVDLSYAPSGPSAG
jgi:nitroimidazol reductase NimA-like FMN-containing flavoprotein (pyridoxamine 5'-phosphate oxidase superfamily)